MLQEEEEEESELETESDLSESHPSEQNDVVELKKEDIGVHLKTPDEKETPKKQSISRMSSNAISRQSSRKSKELNPVSVRQSQIVKNAPDAVSSISKRQNSIINKMGTSVGKAGMMGRLSTM